MTPTAEMRMARSFPGTGIEKRLTEGRRERDVAAVRAEPGEDVGLLECDLGEPVVQRVEGLHIALLERPPHRVEMALLLGEQHPYACDVVLVAGWRVNGQEAIVELGVDLLHPREEVAHADRSRGVALG